MKKQMVGLKKMRLVGVERGRRRRQLVWSISRPC